MKFKTKKYYKTQNELLINELGTNYAKIERLKNEIIELNKSVVELEKCLRNAKNELKQEHEKYESTTAKFNNEIEQKENARRKAAGKAGGLKKDNLKLKEENARLLQELNELKEEKKEHWVKRELPADKGRNTQKMRFKSGARESKIISQVLS